MRQTTIAHTPRTVVVALDSYSVPFFVGGQDFPRLLQTRLVFFKDRQATVSLHSCFASFSVYLRVCCYLLV